MGGYGFTIGESKHFSLDFNVNLNRDEPRFDFFLDVTKNPAKMIFDNRKMVDLLKKELDEGSWKDTIYHRSPVIVSPWSWQVLATENHKLVIQIEASPRYYPSYNCFYHLLDAESTLLDSIEEYNRKESRYFDRFFTEVDRFFTEVRIIKKTIDQGNNVKPVATNGPGLAGVHVDKKMA